MSSVPAEKCRVRLGSLRCAGSYKHAVVEKKLDLDGSEYSEMKGLAGGPNDR